MNREKIKQIEEIVKKACYENKFFSEKEFQWRHTDFVRNFSVKLAKKLKADVELCEVAALLHDIGRMRYGPDDHEITSAKDTDKILHELGYNEEFIKKASRAVLTHRGSTKPDPVTIEEKIVACADAMSHFEDAAMLFAIMNREAKEHKKTAPELIEIFSSKLDRAWVKVCRIPEAQKMLKKKREALKLIFG